EEKPCPITGKPAPKDVDGDDDPSGSSPAERSVEHGKPVQDGSAADGAVKKSSDQPLPTVAPGWHEGKDSVHFRAAPGAELTQAGPNRLEFNRGEVVIDSVRPVVVATPLGEIDLVHRAAVLISVRRGSERCMVLWDAQPDSVFVVFQQRRFSLGPGHE